MLKCHFSGNRKTNFVDLKVQQVHHHVIENTFCQSDNDILLVTPEYQMCLQLKIKELLFENQQQINVTSVFNWETYCQRAPHDAKDYKNLTEQEVKVLLSKQDKHLKICLQNQGFIHACDNIRKVPERGLEQLLYSKLKQSIGDTSFR